jgi:hypothetical protein
MFSARLFRSFMKVKKINLKAELPNSVFTLGSGAKTNAVKSRQRTL